MEYKPIFVTHVKITTKYIINSDKQEPQSTIYYKTDYIALTTCN